MRTFFCKLLPPNTSFPQDMPANEARAMQEHVAYWREQTVLGAVMTFGPVADPAGAFGIAILEVADEGEMLRLTAEDPVIRAALGFRYEVRTMPRDAIHRQTNTG